MVLLTVAELVHKISTKCVWADRLAIVHFFVGGIFLLSYEVLLISPHYYPEWTGWYTFNLCLAAFFAFNIYGNWAYLMFTDVTGKGTVFPSGPAPPGWK